jgi:hypothetical protein
MADTASLITSAQATANSMRDQALAATRSATDALGNITFVGFGFNGPTLPDYQQPGSPPTAPVIPTVTYTAGTAPAAKDYQSIKDLDLSGQPTFNIQPPTPNFPQQPAQLPGSMLAPPSINTSIPFPTPPAALINPIISELVLPDRAEPSKPQTTLPGFTAITPIDTSVAPTGVDTTFANAYSSAAPGTMTMVSGYVDAMLAKYSPQYSSQLAALEAQLSKYMAGGTALNPDIENAIYARAQAKNDVEAKRVQDAAFADTAARGFTMPSGALMSTLALARRDAANANAKAANEIAIAQAEMEQKNLQFAVTTSSNLRTVMLNASLSYMQNLVGINGQAIDYAKSIVSALVESYNIQVKMFSAKLDAYRAEAAVFETRLKAALAGIDLYKTEIAALQALTQVDQAKVEVFRARLDILKTLGDVYQSQINAAQGQANLERLKLDLFRGQVEAYTSQVQAKNAEWQGYSTAVSGEVAKLHIFTDQVAAYSAQTNAYRVKIEGQEAAVRAAGATNEAIGKQNTTALEAFRAQEAAKGEVARTQVSSNQSLIAAYEGATHGYSANAAAQAEYYKAVSNVALEQGRVGAQTVIEGAKVSLHQMEALAHVSVSNAQVLGQMAGSAMAGIVGLAADIKNS